MSTNDKSSGSGSKGGIRPVFFIVGIIVFAVIIVAETVSIIYFSQKSKTEATPEPEYTQSAAPEDTGTPSATPVSTPEATNGNTSAPTAAPTNAPTSAPTTPTNTPASTPTNTPTVTPTNTPTATPTAAPTNTPTATPSNTPAVSGIDDVAARIVDPKDIDFSFLDGVSTERFADCKEGTYDWYPGKVQRDADGNITYPWDRYKSTLDILNKYGAIYRKNADQKVVYLTFDCGYENGNTNRILDILKEKNVQAIFFVTGAFVDYGDMTKSMMERMLAEGHLIGSHTEHHKVMPKLSNEEFCEELNSVYRKLKKVLGEDFTMLYYRPPQGAATPRDLALASYLGYHTTFWAFAYGDYNPDNQPDPVKSLENMENSLHPGCVYLLHAVSSTNAEVLGDLIDYIRAEGYEIRRIDK